MFQDIIIPSRIGSYYVYKKRILSFEISPIMVQAVLLEYHGKTIQIKNKNVIFLKEFSQQAQIAAIKKILSTIGHYDEIVATLSSSAIVFKELELPFLEREALRMVMPYEVEHLLPFALDQAVLDFLIVQQNIAEKTSRILVAAVRIDDIQALLSLFEKAEAMVQTVTIDLFILYEIYHHILAQSYHSIVEYQKKPSLWQYVFKKIGLFTSKIGKKLSKKNSQNALISLSHDVADSTIFQPKRSEAMVNIGYESVSVLYFCEGVLKSIRIIPHGIADVAQQISQETGLVFYDVMHALIVDRDIGAFQSSYRKVMQNLFVEIKRTLLIFEQQDTTYLVPHKMFFSGFGCHVTDFVHEAQLVTGITTEILAVQMLLDKMNILVFQDIVVSETVIVLGSALFGYFAPEINFLLMQARRQDRFLLGKQLITLVIVTVLCITTAWWSSNIELISWQNSYNVSKKQLIQTIEQSLGVDLKNEKNVKSIVDMTKDIVMKEQTVWFSFAKHHESSILQYLQELSVAIDREALGLELRYMHLDYEKVVMTGTVKSFDAIDVFEEELLSLKLLQLINKPRELSWTVELQRKESSKGLV